MLGMLALRMRCARCMSMPSCQDSPSAQIEAHALAQWQQAVKQARFKESQLPGICFASVAVIFRLYFNIYQL